MANIETHNLPVLEVEPHQVREALRCILHTIVFNRALGMLRPQEVDSELFDITYVKCGEPDAEKLIESKLTELCTAVEKRPSELTQLTLSFYERRKKQAWFGTQDERLYWEQWCVNICVLAPDPQLQVSPQVASQRLTKLQRSMEELLAYVVLCVNEKKDHIPPVVSTSTLTFPFDITISGSTARSSLGLNAVKKLLLHATPPPVLS